MGTEVMSLYVEKFNIDNQSKNKIDKRLIKKFAFTVSMTVSICYLSASSLCCFTDYCTKHCFFHSKFQKRLIVDPAKFETKDVMEEFKSACANNPIPKQDLVRKFNFFSCAPFPAHHSCCEATCSPFLFHLAIFVVLQLWFPILHDKHWATCCINILFQEIDSFDSMKTTKKGGSMEIAINNLVCCAMNQFALLLCFFFD
jgi:hypothetical protein